VTIGADALYALAAPLSQNGSVLAQLDRFGFNPAAMA